METTCLNVWLSKKILYVLEKNSTVPGHVLALGPLGVLHEEVPGEEDDGQGQEEQEAVVEISENINCVTKIFYNHSLK